MSQSTEALDIKRMLKGTPVRLRYVSRYSSCRVNHRETVAEHSYFVTLYTALIGKWVEKCSTFEERLNWKELMVRATIHDIEEGRTGDFPRWVKHSSDEIRSALEMVATLEMGSIADELFPPEATAETRSLKADFENCWAFSKDETREGRIIAFADFLSVLSYVIQEIESGNRNASEHITSLTEYFETFNDASYDFIRPLIGDTALAMGEVFIH